MLHNSGSFGPNDVNKMGAPRNISQINGALITPNNAMNADTGQQQTITTSPHYNATSYTNFGHTRYGLPNQMTNYQSAGVAPDFNQIYPNYEPGNSFNTIPILNNSDDNANSDNHSISVCDKTVSDFHQNNYKNESISTREIHNMPQVTPKSFQKRISVDDENSADEKSSDSQETLDYSRKQENVFIKNSNNEKSNDNQEKLSHNQMTFKPHLITELDSTKRKSLENTVRLIENILINTTKNSQFNRTNREKALQSKSENILDVTTENITDNNTTDHEVNENKQTENKTEENSILRDTLLSLSTKLETKSRQTSGINDADDIGDSRGSVTIKIEPVSSWIDAEYSSPFQKDMNCVSRNDVDNIKILEGDEGIAKAKEYISDGLSPMNCFECPYCNVIFKHPKRFLIHTKWHTFGVASEKRSDLTKEKDSRKRLTRERFETSSGSIYSCRECDEVLQTRSALKRHRQIAHPNLSSECKVCKKMVTHTSMSSHMLTHTNDSTFACPECPKIFKYAHSLAKHRDTHLEKIHPCSQCSKLFGSPAQLKLHMKCHEKHLRGANYGCSYCGKAFYESYNLQVHERTHRNEKPFQCSICSTAYGTNSSLQRHMKVSHGNKSKPFECSTCHRCFSTDNIREHHERREHGDPKDYKHVCKHCDSRHATRRYLRKHVLKMHPEIKRRIKKSVDE